MLQTDIIGLRCLLENNINIFAAENDQPVTLSGFVSAYFYIGYITIQEQQTDSQPARCRFLLRI